ncbi:MAG: tail fiber domain-containing protein [Betaproteobacteria bacterium]|nr:tail fiber domain-containing protein [Betaproteobacteria bacterium]
MGVEYTEVDINAPASQSGTWTNATSSSWGDPKFNNVHDKYSYNDPPGYKQFNIPSGMKSAYISHLTWSSGGYVDAYGVQSDGGLVFLRRINTHQAVENTNEGNPDQHDGMTITLAGSGLHTYSAIRLVNKSGRFHLTGLGFVPHLDGTEGTGMVNPDQITGTVNSATTAGSCTGNSATATTATNQSGGTVSATTGTFTGKLSVPSGVSYNPSLQLGTQTTYADDNLYSLRWGGSTLMGMGLHSSTRGTFGKQGLAIHIPDTEEFSVKTNGWTNLFAVDGASKKGYFNGHVGIGTASPGCPLHVVGDSYINIGAGARQWFNYSSPDAGTRYASTGTWGYACIYASWHIATRGSIASVGGVVGASDERIKKDIIDVDDGSALETLRLLKPKQYKYKDYARRGSEPVWGFIAQEVRETLPYATIIKSDSIPNIYELVTVSNSNVITFTNFDTSTLVSNASVLNIFDMKEVEHTITINEVIDEHTIRVEEDLSEWIASIDETGNVVAGNQLFVYGQEVDDFIYLKKEAIFTVATAALQEVDRQLQAEKVKTKNLEARVQACQDKVVTLETLVMTLLARA